MAVIDFTKYRVDDIRRNISKIGIGVFDVMVTGVTGSGKSTTLNSFFQKTVAAVGEGVAPETMEVNRYMLNPFFRIWDTPGLGDSVLIDMRHKEKIRTLLNKTYEKDGVDYGFIDICLVIIEGCNRDMGTTYTLLNDVIVPNIQKERMLVVINQADVAMKGRHWDDVALKPDHHLIEFLETQAYSIKNRVREATGIEIIKPVYYSAKYGWNIQAVIDMIINHMPLKRRNIIKR